LCVEYDGQHVLEDVDLAITAGEFVAVLGPNGSGKTTMVRAALGLQPFDHGRVWLFGTPLQRFRAWRRVALVPQRLPGASSIPVSVWESVRSGLISPRRRWRPLSREEKAAATQALHDVGLWDRRHDRLDALSGGQQRRALVARALALSPDLLVMDEPTAGIDAEHVARLTEVLAGLSERGTTIIVITHELTGIAHLVTRAIALDPHARTSVAFDGPPPLPGRITDGVHHHDDGPDRPGSSAIGLEP
ncbi:MAG: metal ABC transporter ATP-binding protein, partial [Candidatus Nanopelagicales bacterium]